MLIVHIMSVRLLARWSYEMNHIITFKTYDARARTKISVISLIVQLNLRMRNILAMYII